MEHNFTIVVINESQKYALQLSESSLDSSESSVWSFPEGEIEDGESAQAAAAREFLEDFDIPAKDSEFKKVGIYTNEGEDIIVLTYTGAEYPRHSNDSQSFQYFSLQEIEEIPLSFSQEHLLPLLENFERGNFN